jgi:hypothetical protein
MPIAPCICVGASEAEKARASLPHDRVSYLPNGVDSARFSSGNGPAFRLAHNIPADAFLLVAIGRAEVAQGHVNSRYYVLGAVTWALVIFLQLEEWHTEARPYRALRWAVPLLALFNVTANARFAKDAATWVTFRDNAAHYYMHYGRDGVGSNSLHPDPAYATRLLREAEQAGLYHLVRQSETRQFPAARRLTWIR